MFETFRNAWKIEDLRKRLLFTLLILVIFRLGCAIPVPYITAGNLKDMFDTTGSMLTYLDMMSGNALSQCAIFALGVQPYINASIIVQLLTVAIPYLENLSKEGEEGRRKLTRITNYVGCGIGLMLSIAYYFILRRSSALEYTDGFAGIFSAIVIILCFTAGSQLVTWMGNQIDSKGIGNGVSLLIFAGIVANWSRVLTMVQGVLAAAQTSSGYYILLPVILVLAIVAVIFVVILTNAERRIPVQYAKRVVGRKMYGGQSTHIPLKINASGVLPLIFASAIMQFPATIFAFFPNSSINQWWNANVHAMSWGYQIIFALLIIAFTFFYSSISFNPVEIAKNMQQNGGMIPGIRQGKPTSDFILKISRRITLFGALFLALLAVLPTLIYAICGVSLPFAASSLLIAVSVAMETMRQLESQMTMRHYKGFLN